ncbi:MAG: hypothetical protein EAZ53_01875 [Bacteroidetes bacterium]|nr:MAG: hypothetical protein EAZ53_01875 [Bacteroidota bacterium]
MNTLLILFNESKYFNMISKAKNHDFEVIFDGISYDIKTNENQMIGFIDWHLNSKNKIIKIEVDFLSEFQTEFIEKTLNSNFIQFDHEYNKGILNLISNDIIVTKSFMQTFNLSAFLVNNNLISGFLFDIDLLIEEIPSLSLEKNGYWQNIIVKH